jgi:hypothetical protein
MRNWEKFITMITDFVNLMAITMLMSSFATRRIYRIYSYLSLFFSYMKLIMAKSIIPASYNSEIVMMWLLERRAFLGLDILLFTSKKLNQ